MNIRPLKKSFLDEHELSLNPTVIEFDGNGYHQICGFNAHSLSHVCKSR